MTALITDHVWRPDTWTPIHRRDPEKCQYAWCDRPREQHARHVSEHYRRRKETSRD